jgi:hypothetical protein
MMAGMKTTEEQRASLRLLVAFATSPVVGHCNFGVMLMLSPDGDVSFLAPIAPELRGVEIVSPYPPKDDGKEYDIWKRGHLVQTYLSASEVVEWLNSQCRHSEAEYVQHGRNWAEDALRFYAVKGPVDYVPPQQTGRAS